MTAVERIDYKVNHVDHHEDLERRVSELESLVMDHELCLKAHAEKIYPPKRRSPVKPRTPRTSKKECADDD